MGDLQCSIAGGPRKGIRKGGAVHKVKRRAPRPSTGSAKGPSPRGPTRHPIKSPTPNRRGQ